MDSTLALPAGERQRPETGRPQDPGRPAGPSGTLLVGYGRIIGPLLAGYLLFDKAFAYLHLPGAPLFIGEAVLLVGLLGAATATGYLRVPVRDEPVLAVFAAFVLWGLVRTLPGLGEYGIMAVRDAALWYYCGFAFLVVAALARSPDLVDRLIVQLERFVPWMLLWLPLAVVLSTVPPRGPKVPWTTVSVLTHKPGNVAVAALLALGSLWLFPGRRAGRSRALWSFLAMAGIVLAATQNRGGLLGVLVGGLVGVMFMPRRTRRAVVGVAAGSVVLSLVILLAMRIPVMGTQGREFSAAQLTDNVLSLGGTDVPGNLNGTVAGRLVLWTRVIDRQVDTGHLVDGSGFGPNLAVEVGVYDAGLDTLRGPHNSHLDVLARMGLLGLALWIVLWSCWYWRMVSGCRRLAREGPRTRRQVSVLSLMMVTAILVSSVFDPQLEGAQVAALLWTAAGLGVAATSRRPWSVGAGRPGR